MFQNIESVCNMTQQHPSSSSSSRRRHPSPTTTTTTPTPTNAPLTWSPPFPSSHLPPISDSKHAFLSLMIVTYAISNVRMPAGMDWTVMQRHCENVASAFIKVQEWAEGGGADARRQRNLPTEDPVARDEYPNTQYLSQRQQDTDEFTSSGHSQQHTDNQQDEDTSLCLSLQDISQQTGVELAIAERIIDALVRTGCCVRRQRVTSRNSQNDNSDTSDVVYQLVPILMMIHLRDTESEFSQKYASPYASAIVYSFFRIKVRTFHEVRAELLERVRENLSMGYGVKGDNVPQQDQLEDYLRAESQKITRCFARLKRDSILRTMNQDMTTASQPPHQDDEDTMVDDDTETDNHPQQADNSDRLMNYTQSSAITNNVKEEPVSDEDEFNTAEDGNRRMSHLSNRGHFSRHAPVTSSSELDPSYLHSDFQLDIEMIFRHWQADRVVEYVRKHYGIIPASIVRTIINITKVYARDFPLITRFVKSDRIHQEYKSHHGTTLSMEKLNSFLTTLLRKKIVVLPRTGSSSAIVVDANTEVAVNVGYIHELLRTEIILDVLEQKHGAVVSTVYKILQENKSLEEGRFYYDYKVASREKIREALQTLRTLDIAQLQTVNTNPYTLNLWSAGPLSPREMVLNQLYYIVYVLRKRRDAFRLQLSDWEKSDDFTLKEDEYWNQQYETVISTEVDAMRDLMIFEEWR